MVFFDVRIQIWCYMNNAININCSASLYIITSILCPQHWFWIGKKRAKLFKIGTSFGMEIRRRVADPYQWPLVGLGSAFPRELDPDVHQCFHKSYGPRSGCVVRTRFRIWFLSLGRIRIHIFLEGRIQSISVRIKILASNKGCGF